MGPTFARDVNTRLAGHVDVMIGNEEDFTAALGFEVAHVDEHLSTLPMDSFEAMVGTVAEKMPWFKVIATTLRTVHSASDNDWQAIAWSPETGVLASAPRDHLGIFDRVGGGDGFASGLVYGLLEGEPLQQCLELGAAHGALAMTTPGDTSMATARRCARSPAAAARAYADELTTRVAPAAAPAAPPPDQVWAVDPVRGIGRPGLFSCIVNALRQIVHDSGQSS